MNSKTKLSNKVLLLFIDRIENSLLIASAVRQSRPSQRGQTAGKDCK